jgi:hypothetical protein
MSAFIQSDRAESISPKQGERGFEILH